jgi:hypothetical protein
LWGVIIIGIFLVVGAIYGVPAMVTGTDSGSVVIKQITPWVVGAVFVVIVVIGGFFNRK